MSRIAMVVAVVLLTAMAMGAEKKGWVPKNGFVPDSQTATRIAEAVWIPIYGEEHIAKEKPFVAVLRGDTWHVRGTLPKGAVGGTAIAEIAKLDGRIIWVIHEQ